MTVTGYQTIYVDDIVVCDHMDVPVSWGIGCSTNSEKALDAWVGLLREKLPGHKITAKPGRCYGSFSGCWYKHGDQS